MQLCATRSRNLTPRSARSLPLFRISCGFHSEQLPAFVFVSKKEFVFRQLETEVVSTVDERLVLNYLNICFSYFVHLHGPVP